MDKLSQQFVNANVDDHEMKIEEAEKVVQAFQDKKQLETAKKYLSIMRKISSKGLNYVNEEIQRIQKMMKEKLTEPKKKSFQTKLNILESFKFAAKKDEL